MAQLIRKAIKVLLLAAQMKGHFAFENFESNAISNQVTNVLFVLGVLEDPEIQAIWRQ